MQQSGHSHRNRSLPISDYRPRTHSSFVKLLASSHRLALKTRACCRLSAHSSRSGRFGIPEIRIVPRALLHSHTVALDGRAEVSNGSMEASPKLAMMPFAREPKLSFDSSSMTISGNRRGSLTDDIVEKRRLRRTINGMRSLICEGVPCSSRVPCHPIYFYGLIQYSGRRVSWLWGFLCTGIFPRECHSDHCVMTHAHKLYMSGADNGLRTMKRVYNSFLSNYIGYKSVCHIWSCGSCCITHTRRFVHLTVTLSFAACRPSGRTQERFYEAHCSRKRSCGTGCCCG